MEIVVDTDSGGFARVEHKDKAPLGTQRAANASQGIKPAVSGNKVQGAVHENEIKLLLDIQLKQILPSVSICIDHWLASRRHPVPAIDDDPIGLRLRPSRLQPHADQRRQHRWLDPRRSDRRRRPPPPPSFFERIREFGIMRSIGWSRVRVLSLVLDAVGSRAPIAQFGGIY